MARKYEGGLLKLKLKALAANPDNVGGRVDGGGVGTANQSPEAREARIASIREASQRKEFRERMAYLGTIHSKGRKRGTNYPMRDIDAVTFTPTNPEELRPLIHSMKEG